MAKQAKVATPASRWTALFWKIVGVGILMVVLLFVFTALGIFGALPNEKSLENPDSNLASQIMTADGVTIGKIYRGNENRTPVTYDELPLHLTHALVSTEDERFYDHSGIDARGTARALAYLGSKGGASTITQQLAKQFYTGRASGNIVVRSFQKLQEMITATRLERNYTKEEIIAMYLNQVDFNNRGVGIRSASRIYFGKEPKDLKLEEAAVFVAMLKNPSLYNPKREKTKEFAFNRRNQVFKQMERNGYLTTAEKDSLQALPMVINFTPETHNDGSGTYVREFIRAEMKEFVKENKKPDGTNYDIYEDGLKIFTTLDSRMQKHGEDAVLAHMNNLQREFDEQNEKNKTAPFRDLDKDEIERLIMKPAMRRSERYRVMKNKGMDADAIYASFDVPTEMTVFTWNGDRDTTMTPRDSILHYKKHLRAGMMSMDPLTGEVKAWVGGINHRHFKYDAVKQGKRQVGSTFKPFLYATAVSQLHYSPCEQFPNVQFTIEKGKFGNTKDWTPKNSGGDYGGMVTLREALAKSLNTVSAQLMDKVGPKPVLDLVQKMGVDTKDIPAVPSLALGSAEISLYDMVGAYGTFANQGIYTEPYLISRIEDKNGRILYQHTPETRDVMSAETAYVTLSLMEGVTQAGSGGRLRHSWATGNKFYKETMTGYPYAFTNPIAGKTGTTQNQSDGWFMGIVPNLVTGAWVGGEDRSTHFPTIKYGQGATMALPIWGQYMKAVYADEDLKISDRRFPKPSDLDIETNCDEFRAALDNPLGEDGTPEPDDSDELDF